MVAVDTDNNGQHSGTEIGLPADGIHNIFSLVDYQFVVVKDFAGDFAGVGQANTTVTLDLLGHTIDMTDALYPFSMQAENLVVLFKSTAQESGVLIGKVNLVQKTITFTLDNVRHEGELNNNGTIYVQNGATLCSKIKNEGTIYLPEGYDLSTIVSYTGSGTLYVGEKALVYNAESGKLECAADHIWVDADCTTAKTCSTCGVTDGEALGHDTNGPATCEEDEYCSRCDSVVQEKLGHTEKVVSATDPTCEGVGYTESIVCANCDHVFVAPTERPALGHTESAPVNENVVDATCVAAGSYEEVVYCSVCTEELSRVNKTTPALGHDEVESVYIERAPTCTADGYVIYKYTCNNCGTYRYSEQIPVLAKGHTPGHPEVINQGEPECEYEGFVTSVINCTVCNGTIETIEETLPATGHTPNIDAPTCTQEKSCTVCYALIETFAPHDYEETVHEATCFNQGGIHHECSHCGSSYLEVTQEALGHDYNIESATCEEDKHCLRCDFVAEPATGHTNVWATCTTPHYCSVCEEVLSPANGHNFGEDDVPDCTRSKECFACGYVEAEALGHDPDKEAPTCDEDVYCTRCSAVLAYATGHTYNNDGGVTCTEDYYCTTCGEIFGYAGGHVPMFGSVQCEVDNTCIHCGFLIEEAAGHDYKATTLREASCQSEGVISHTCQRCYNSYEEYPPQLEHDHVKQDDVPSICTQQGYTGATVCTICGMVSTPQKPLPLADHKDDNADGKCDVCNYQTTTPEETTSAVPEETTPVVPEETTPVVPEETTPVVPEETTPVVPEETTPVLPEETTPVVPEETTPVVPEETTPVVPEETTPGVPEETTPVVPEETTPAVPEETTPVVPEETTPVVPEETAPVVPEETAPEESDQKLSSGAVASIVAGSTVVAGGGGFSLFWFVIKKKSWAELLTSSKKILSKVARVFIKN